MSEELGLLIAEVEALKRSLERTAVVEYPVGGGGGAPANAQYVVLALNAGLSQERVLTGTANQVIVTDNGANSTVVLSTPQNIHTGASPTFVGLTLTGLGAGATDVVVTLSAGNVLEQRTIDARAWGSSLVDGSGAAGRVAYWLDGDTLTSDGDFTFDGSQLALAVQGNTGGVLVGGDVQWYRSAADVWRTPDSVVVDGNIGVRITPTADLHTATTSESAARGVTIDQYSAGAIFPALLLGRKSRHTTIGSHTAVQNGDILFQFVGRGSDGSDFAFGGTLRMVTVGTPVASHVPTHCRISLDNATALTDAMQVSFNGSMALAGTSFPSGGGTPVIVLAQASGNPTGMPSNTAGLFAKDVSGTCELFGVDEAGAVNQLTAHALDGPADMRWQRGLLADIIHKDENTFTGGVRWTNVTLMAAALEWAMGELVAMGRAVPKEFGRFQHEEKAFEPELDWNAHQAHLVAEREAEIAWWDRLSVEERKEQPPRPAPLAAKPAPAWLVAAREKARDLPIGPIPIDLETDNGKP